MFYITVLSILFFLYEIRRSRIDLTSQRMLRLFLIYWLVSIVLAKLQVYDLYEVSPYTYFLVGLGVVSFSLGFLLVAKTRNSSAHINKEDVSTQIDRIISYLPYQIVLIISSIYIYTLLVTFFGQLMVYGSLYDVRNDYYAGELYGSLFTYIDSFVLHPLYLITLPLFAYMLLYKRNWYCLVSGFYLLGYESLGGGRIGYIRIVLGVIFLSYCLLRTFKKQQKRGFVITIVGGIAIFTLISFVSAARQGELGLNAGKTGSEVALEHIVTYTAGPIVAFDYSIKKDYSRYLGGYQHGNLTLTPAISLINLFSSRIGVSFPLSLRILGEHKQGDPIQVSDDMSWVALYTANLYFYNDFGALGVVLFPLLFGMIISALISQLFKFKSMPLVAIVSFCFWLMMDSVLDYGFVDPYVFLSLIIIYLFGIRKKYLTIG